MDTISLWNNPELLELFDKEKPLIDVRSPFEFKLSSIKGSVNLPILNDEERALVGTCYKQEGQDKAILLGHQLISGNVKSERIKKWCDYFTLHPKAQLFCFRGGLRSTIACQWICENGISVKPLPGGYKAIRQFLLSWLNEAPLPPLIRLAGPTGSGKTELLSGPFLKKFSIDLEECAFHRGSAFGHLGPQPTQSTFESSLAILLLKKRNLNHTLLIEDESAMIGQLRIPSRLYEHMRSSPYILIEEKIENRINRIYQDYVLTKDKVFFLTGLESIKKKLGGAIYKSIYDLIEKAYEKPPSIREHELWIKILLEKYYDPFYKRGLEREKAPCLFRGHHEEILNYFQTSKEIYGNK